MKARSSIFIRTLLLSLMLLSLSANAAEQTAFRNWLSENSIEFREGISGDAQTFEYQSVLAAADRFMSDRHCLPLEQDLTDDEKVSLTFYASYGYKKLNSILRGQDQRKIEQVSLYSELLSKALSRLPSKRGLVYRYTNLPPEVLANYRIGDQITLKGFTSTSSDPDWKLKGKQFGKVLFQISTNNGKEISCLSTMPAESEWLLDKNSVFEIQNMAIDAASETAIVNLIDRTLPSAYPDAEKISFKKRIETKIFDYEVQTKEYTSESNAAAKACFNQESCSYEVGSSMNPAQKAGKKLLVLFTCYWKDIRLGFKIETLNPGDTFTYSCPAEFIRQ